MTKIQKWLSGVVASLALALAIVGNAYAEFSSTTVNTIIDDVIGDIGGILSTILPTVFGFVALLVALFWGVRYVISRLRNAG